MARERTPNLPMKRRQMSTKPEGYRKTGRKRKPKRGKGGNWISRLFVAFSTLRPSHHKDVRPSRWLFLTGFLGRYVHEDSSFDSFQMNEIELIVKQIAGSAGRCFTTRATQCDWADSNVIGDFLWHGSIIAQREC
jgi:hypothetical protein